MQDSRTSLQIGFHFEWVGTDCGSILFKKRSLEVGMQLTYQKSDTRKVVLNGTEEKNEQMRCY